MLGKLAICPYYKRDTAVSISCEGLAPNSGIVHFFGNQESKKAWGKCACCSKDYGKRCMVAAALDEVYDDE